VGSFLTVAANLVLINLTLAPLQHRAIALSTSLSMVFNFLFLGAMLYRKLGDYQVRGLLVTLAKVAVASLTMGLAVHYAHPLLLERLGEGLAGQTGALGAVILLGLGLYGLLASRLNIPEFQDLLRQLRSRWAG
jgi:putative peptidoglycan lipid II flippase